MATHTYRAFIASPGDVKKERALAENVISRINRSTRDTIGKPIDVRKWEHLPPVTPALPEERIQDVLNREVEQCHFFILILNKRYGRIEPGHTVSNTEREVETILRAHERDPKLKILAYFKQLDVNDDQGPQEKKVRDLRARLAEMGVPYRPYKTASEFECRLTDDIYDVVLRIHLSPFKIQALRGFWRFGDTDRPHDPQVAVIYPPMPRSLAVDGEEADYWLKRLTSQIAFEDFKALQKIEKAFRLMSLSSYRVYPHVNPPPEHPWLNRVLLCLPRNRLGVAILKEHAARRFMISPQANGEKPVIEWRSQVGDIIVRSPMSAYLRLQRSRMNTLGDWHGQLDRIIAKDFAIVARFQRQSVGDVEPLWDYFIAGIRGLGTWGAGWFMDREFKSLTRFSRSEDIQLLLEVTFRNGRIATVADVSDKPQEYFDKANDPAHIEELTRLFSEGG